MQAARGASLISDQHPQPQHRSRLALLATIAAVAWLVDQATKVLAVRHLDGRDPVELVGWLLQLNLTRNPGAAFSAGSGFTVFISAFAIIALVVACWFAALTRTTGWAWGLGLVIAGIAGNLTDRLLREPSPLRGHVVDFLQLPNWPIFNVADICINVGAVLVVIQMLRGIHLDGTREDARPTPEQAS